MAIGVPPAVPSRSVDTAALLPGVGIVNAGVGDASVGGDIGGRSSNEGKMVDVSVRNAMSGETLMTAIVDSSQSVQHLADMVAKTAGLPSMPRLLLGSQAMEPAKTLEEAGVDGAVSPLDLSAVLMAPLWIATGSEDGSAKVWSVDFGTCLHTFGGHVGPVSSARFAQDRSEVVTTGLDGFRRRCVLRSGECLKIEQAVPVAGEAMWCGQPASFSPNGELAVSGGLDFVARIWNRKTGRCECDLWGHTRPVNCAVFSSDGESVATASADRTARVWDPLTGATRAVLRGHQGGVMCVAFSPDCQMVATGSRDNTVKLWDASTGECLATYLGHTGAITTICFAP